VHVWQLGRTVLLLLACSHAILSIQQVVVGASPMLTPFPFLTSAVTHAPAYQKEHAEKEFKALGDRSKALEDRSCPQPHPVGGRGVGSAAEAGGGEGAHLNPKQGAYGAHQAQAPLRSSGGAAEQVAGREMEQAMVSENQEASVQQASVQQAAVQNSLAGATEARDKMEQGRDVAMLYPDLTRGGTLAQSLNAFILQLQSTSLGPR